jgi:hypothetical protein
MCKSQIKTLKLRNRGAVLIYGDSQRTFNHQSHNNLMKHVQLYGHTRYQSFEKPLFNNVQQRLYAEAVYGLSLYNQEQLQHLPKSKKHEILVIFKKTQEILNIFKQQVINQQVNPLFQKFFPKSKVANVMLSVDIDATVKCKIPFKELNITQQMIANKLVEMGILPINFYELT